MNKGKLVLFSVLLLIIVSFLIYQIFFSNQFLSVEDRSVKNNPAQKMSLTNGTYLVDEEIEPGFYDIYYESGSVTFRDIILSEGDIILNEPINSGTEIEIEGQGKVTLKPSSFDAIDKNENELEIGHSGSYLAGKEIPPGDYNIKLSGDSKNVNPQVFIKVSSSLSSDDNSQSLDITSFKDNKNITISEGQFLEINKVDEKKEEVNELSVVLNSR
ncbi:hypothetical protein CHH58_13405 [Terribacillus saccharophilus]|uniref:hypothetical protein n=1 Tax=Terribacillus saccharophilus TaxID=361277 RepID=UPI000BA505E6|nr:hypothetical protein [Terribacillus saccharophilus]PAF36242.1 hypothetical protein CHH58_13405 [Terribacillus saccharophilus]